MRRLVLFPVVLFAFACHRTEATPSAQVDAIDAAVAAAGPLDPTDPAGLSRASESLAEIAPALVVTPAGATAIAWTSRCPLLARRRRDVGADANPRLAR